MAPLTWGELPVQSTHMRSPCLRRVHSSRMGRPVSMPSSSIQSSKLNSPSGNWLTAARVRRSAYSMTSCM